MINRVGLLVNELRIDRLPPTAARNTSKAYSFGISTVSITWITPLVQAISGLVTLALFTMTLFP